MPGRASCCVGDCAGCGNAVSILAPRCRGAHRPGIGFKIEKRRFQSSRPVAGARIQSQPRRQAAVCRFNPRAPLPGRASSTTPDLDLPGARFQSSRPVAGARIYSTALYRRVEQYVSILAPRCRGAHLKAVSLNVPISSVSILAPRCRGAHRISEADQTPILVFQSSRPVAGARIRFANSDSHFER